MDLGPNGREEKLFRPLEETNRELDVRLKERFVEVWLPAAGFPEARPAAALETVELKLGPDTRGSRLRITSRFTGTTRWLHEWLGDEGSAMSFMDEVAELEARWVHDERRLHGPSEWD